MKSQPDSYTRVEIDQLVEGIYRTLETTQERLDMRCDDIYFPMDLTMISLTSQIEAIHGEIVEIHGYTLVDQKHKHRSTDATTNRPTVTDEHRSTKIKTEAG
ncbi:hypothetical protein DY000_02007225 [Brassica cretica]|uniref:Uncharacterized protein n=1 Tax=Brassica cretica TaxID=69181 RepID=A0ABQ7C8E4_BRACR|nr:hypothetical protein DY000_02007225 [Brassica cretica]